MRKNIWKFLEYLGSLFIRDEEVKEEQILVYTKGLPRKARIRYTDIKSVLETAYMFGYFVVSVDYNSGMIRMVNSEIDVAINFYSTTFTVTTELNHPTKGKTQLHRKNLSMQQILEVLENPRAHTGKGYYKKSTS